MPPALRTRRIVLFPDGQPHGELDRDQCAQFFIALGGDITRVIDEPSGLIDRFAAYIQRIEAIVEGQERPIVVLTNTNPLALTVIAARRKLENAVPALRDATWVIFLDPAKDPFFVHTARTLGAFADGLAGAVKWTSPDRNTFLIATPSGVDIDWARRRSGASDPVRTIRQGRQSAVPARPFQRSKPRVERESLQPAWDDSVLSNGTDDSFAPRFSPLSKP